MDNHKDLLRQIPPNIRKRLFFIPPYVKEQLFPKLASEKKSEKIDGFKKSIMRRQIDEMSIILTIHFLYHFYMKGYYAVQETLSFLELNNVHAFKIGSTNFAKDNENANMGLELANGLLACLTDEGLKRSIIQKDHSWELIEFCKMSYGYGRT